MGVDSPCSSSHFFASTRLQPVSTHHAAGGTVMAELFQFWQKWPTDCVAHDRSAGGLLQTHREDDGVWGID